MYFIVRAAAWGDVDVVVRENCVCVRSRSEFPGVG